MFLLADDSERYLSTEQRSAIIFSIGNEVSPLHDRLYLLRRFSSAHEEEYSSKEWAIKNGMIKVSSYFALQYEYYPSMLEKPFSVMYSQKNDLLNFGISGVHFCNVCETNIIATFEHPRCSECKDFSIEKKRSILKNKSLPFIKCLRPEYPAKAFSDYLAKINAEQHASRLSESGDGKVISIFRK